MVTEYSSKIVDNLLIIINLIEAKEDFVKEILSGGKEPSGVTFFTENEYQILNDLETFYDGLRTEINKNILQTNDDFNLQKYLHHLCKIYVLLKPSLNKYYTIYNGIKEIFPSGVGIIKGTKPCNDKKTFLLIYSALYERALIYPDVIKDIISVEFGFKSSELDKLFFENHPSKNNRRIWFRHISPTIGDMKKLFLETPSNQVVESLPEYKFETISQKIAWLNELGILEKVLIDSSDKGYMNCSRAANILSTFIDIKPDTIRKSIEAIYKPNDSNKKNNPLNNKENQLFIESMRAKFKLDRTKED